MEIQEAESMGNEGWVPFKAYMLSGPASTRFRSLLTVTSQGTKQSKYEAIGDLWNPKASQQLSLAKSLAWPQWWLTHAYTVEYTQWVRQNY